MSKKLAIQSRILRKVEKAMLDGSIKPTQILKIVPEIRDWRVAKLYIGAVREAWNEQPLEDLKTIRKNLIHKAQLLETEFDEIAEGTDNDAVKVGAKKGKLEAQRQQQSLHGLDMRRLIFSKEDNPFGNLSDDELEERIRRIVLRKD